jgi:hypothetical protein
MPIALDPNETVEIVLAIDADKPAEQQAKFIVHFLTCRETIQFEKLIAGYGRRHENGRRCRMRLHRRRPRRRRYGEGTQIRGTVHLHG